MPKYLYPVNMGATAIGTGINVPKGYPEKCAAHLAELTGKPITPASDMISATWDQQGFVVYSAALKSLAIKLSKISSDLILLTSGPRAGLFEINLPALQPGSSIMPDKVDPQIHSDVDVPFPKEAVEPVYLAQVRACEAANAKSNSSQ
jgi:aspartate ammonia-lyase